MGEKISDQKLTSTTKSTFILLFKAELHKAELKCDGKKVELIKSYLRRLEQIRTD